MWGNTIKSIIRVHRIYFIYDIQISFILCFIIYKMNFLQIVLEVRGTSSGWQSLLTNFVRINENLVLYLFFNVSLFFLQSLYFLVIMLSISVIQYLCSYQHQLTKPIAAVELHQLQGENDAELNKLQRVAASTKRHSEK